MSNLLKILEQYKKEKIAIYGLGAETERILHEMGRSFQVVGLLDGYREEGMLYGMRIISMQEAIAHHVKLILVAARPGSCRAIAKRIGAKCMEHQIAVYDVRGNDLCDVRRAVYDLKNVSGITKGELRKQIKEHEVISFDLFDTLIVRQIPAQEDVFELIDDRLRQCGIIIEDFSRRRIAAEKELSKRRAPRLTEIYAYMRHTYHIGEIDPEQMAMMEWEIDCGLIIPRREVCEILASFSETGKKVYIVSDSYYNRKQITGILKKCGITHYTDVFVSCEYGVGKTQGLFQAYKEAAGAGSYLHIGDDVAADVENAEKSGIDACRLYSALDLLEFVGYMGLWEYTDSLSDRIRIGMFAARVFNSPFWFETKQRKIGIGAAYDIGYVFFAPMICDFVLWFREQVEKYRIENILFCARDGYLVKQMYDELCNKLSSVYFLTSRMAAVRAGVEDAEDIHYVGAMKFSGSLTEQLRERFGISVETGQENGRTELLDYAREIYERSAINRKNYLRYIESLGLRKGEAAFFDFVAKGTTQMYMARMMQQHLKGIYFLRLDKEQMEDKNLDITSFYDMEEEDSVIFRDYYILETMLTAPMPSIKGFDEEGVPIYAQETRKASDIRCFQEAQEGIRGYFREYLRLCPISGRRINKRLDEMFLVLIHKLEIADEDFLSLKIEDPFFNRMTDMVDIL